MTVKIYGRAFARNASSDSKALGSFDLVLLPSIITRTLKHSASAPTRRLQIYQRLQMLSNRLYLMLRAIPHLWRCLIWLSFETDDVTLPVQTRLALRCFDSIDGATTSL